MKSHSSAIAAASVYEDGQAPRPDGPNAGTVQVCALPRRRPSPSCAAFRHRFRSHEGESSRKAAFSSLRKKSCALRFLATCCRHPWIRAAPAARSDARCAWAQVAPSAEELAVAASGVNATLARGMQDATTRTNKFTSVEMQNLHHELAVPKDDWCASAVAANPTSVGWRCVHTLHARNIQLSLLEVCRCTGTSARWIALTPHPPHKGLALAASTHRNPSSVLLDHNPPPGPWERDATSWARDHDDFLFSW